MSREADAASRRIEREIAIFEGQAALHQHAAAMNWRNVNHLTPALEAVFGCRSLHGIYAGSIASAIARTGREEVYSLGCGDGAQELLVLRQADEMGLPPFRIRGLELAPGVAERANAAAAAAGLGDRLRVEVHNLNGGLPGEGPVAAVMAHHFLHHVVALEALFHAVAERLHPEGAFVTFDMIGRNGHMRWPEVRPLVRRLWAMLPREKRRDHVFGRPMPFFQDWDCAIEGFEGVRAQDILGLIAGRFQVGRFWAWGGLTEAFLGERVAPGFDPADEADRTFLIRLAELEARLLRERRTTPTEMGAEFRSRRSAFRPDAETEDRFRRSVRAPAEVFPSLEGEAFASPYPAEEPAPLPVLARGASHGVVTGGPAAASLREGWEEPDADGVWAVLDEQRIAFRSDRRARSVTLKIWNGLDEARGPEITAQANGRASVSTGPLKPGQMAELHVGGAGLFGRSEWEITLRSAAYRLPDLDGGEDRRPLAYRLVAITPRRGPLWRGPLWRGPLWRGPLWRGPLWRGPLWRRPLWRA